MDMAKPIIRFKGYQDDWEQRKFGDVGSVAMCKRIFKEQTSDEGEVPFYKIGTFGGVPDAFISRELFDEYKVKYPYPNKGDILISASGSIGRTVEFTGKNEYFQDSNIVWFKHGNEIDNSFLKVLYSVIEWSCEGSTIKRLYNDNFLKTEFMLPQIDEQKKIGTYFSTLDHLITLHQRKCDETKRLKKYMLQKMFPQNGEKVPEIRFSGFTDDWEQRKLGEVCEIKDSARIPNSEWSESGVPYIRASDVTNENTDGVLFISQERYEFYKNRTGAPTKDDVLFNGGGEIGKSLLITDKKPIYVQGGAVLYARTSKSRELVGQYLKTYFETTNAKSYVDTASAGGTMRHFTLKPSQMMRILMPSVEEQEKIGEYFANFDHLITLHQRELENLQNIKKFMLGKMFV